MVGKKIIQKKILKVEEESDDDQDDQSLESHEDSESMHSKCLKDASYTDSDADSSDSESSDSESASVISSIDEKEPNKMSDKRIAEYLVEPTDDTLDSYRFPRIIRKILLTNRLDVISVQCSKSIFERLYNMHLTKPEDNRRRRAPRGGAVRKLMPSGQRILNRIIKTVMTTYYKYCVFKNTDALTHETRAYILNILIDYYDIVGKTSMLVNSFIKCRLWGLLDLVNKRTPLSGKDITIKKITDAQVEDLNKIGVTLTGDCRSLFTYNNPEFILKHIIDTNMFADGISMDDIHFIKDDKILKHLCDNGLISLKKKAIREYHIRCYMYLLNYLIDNELIAVNAMDVKSIFRKKVVKKIKTKEKKLRGRRRYYGRRRRMMNKSYNKNTASKDFKDNISRYIALIKEKGFDIPAENYVKYSFLFNKRYDTFIELVASKEKNAFKIDTYEKYDLFRHCIKTDDVEKIKILIDKNVILITELHKDNKYVTDCIRDDAEKIAKYIIEELRVKCVDFSAQTIWGWSLSRVPNDKILKGLRLMKSVGIPLQPTLLSTMLNKKKSADLIDALIDEFGFKIEKTHMKYLKSYPVKTFHKFTKDIPYNKKTMIRSLISRKETRYYWRYRNSATGAKIRLAMNLISKLTQKERDKLIPTYVTNALVSNNLDAMKALKDRYKIDPDMEMIKKFTNEGKLKQSGIEIVKSLISTATEKQDIQKIKTTFSDTELMTLISNQGNDRYNDNDFFNKKNIPLIKKLQVQIDVPSLEKLLGMNIYYYDSNKNKIHMIVALIKQHKLYKKANPEFLQNICKSLITSPDGLEIISHINDQKHNCIEHVTGAQVHSMILAQVGSGKDSNIDIIGRHFSHLVTPYTYTILGIALKAQNNNYDIWNKKGVQVKDISQLQTLQKEILREDYQTIKDQVKIAKKVVSPFSLRGKKGFKIIAKYEPKPEEIPDTLDYYTHMAAGQRPRHDDDDNDQYDQDRAILNDIDKALLNAQVEDIDADAENLGQAVVDQFDAESDMVDDVEDLDEAVNIIKAVKKKSVRKSKSVYKKIEQN